MPETCTNAGAVRRLPGLCGGPRWRAATRPVAGRYAAWFQGRYAANELT